MSTKLITSAGKATKSNIDYQFTGDFRVGSTPTLLDSVEAQKIKRFIENLVFRSLFEIQTGRPAHNKFEIDFSKDDETTFNLWLQTALVYDTDPTLAGSLTMSGGSFKCNSPGTRFNQYKDEGFRITPQNTTSDTDDAAKASVRLMAWSGGPYNIGFIAPDTADLAGSGSLDGDNGLIWTLPFEDGTDGQVLKTDGSKVLEFVDPGGYKWIASADATLDNPISFDVINEEYLKFLSTDGSGTWSLQQTSAAGPNTPPSWLSLELTCNDQLFEFSDGANDFTVTSSAKTAAGYDTVTFTSSDASVTIDCSTADTIDLTAAGGGGGVFPLSTGAENEVISLTSLKNPQRVENVKAIGGGSGADHMIQWDQIVSTVDEYMLGFNSGNAGVTGVGMWVNLDATGAAVDYPIFDAYSAAVSTGQACTISVGHTTHNIDNTDTSWATNPGLDIVNDGRIVFRTADPAVDDNEFCTIKPTVVAGNSGEFTIPSNYHDGLASPKRNGIVDTTDGTTGAQDLKWADVIQGNGEFSTVSNLYGSGLHFFADGAGSHQHAIRSGNMVKFIGGTDIDCTTTLTYDAVNNQVLEVQIDSTGGGGGGGTVTSVNGAGTSGITVTGGPITTSGTLTVDLDDTAVTPDTYGDANNVAQITIDQQGRITSATEVAIAGGGGGGMTSFDFSDGANTFTVTDGDTVELTSSDASVTIDCSLADTIDLTAAGGGGGAPTGAEYVVISANGSLTAERVLTAGTNITITDGGANGNVTIATTTDALTVMDIDTFPTVTSVNTIKFTNGSVTDDGGGVVTVDVSGGGSGMSSFICTNGVNPFTIDSTSNTLTFAAETGLAWDFGVGGTAKITHTLMDEFFVSDGANSWNVEDNDTFEVSSSDGFVFVDCSTDRIVDLTDGLSDESVKDKVKPLEGAFEKLRKLRAVSFEWNKNAPRERDFCKARTGGKRDFGFIAQEVEKVLPEIVGTRRDGKKTIKHSKLTPLLLDAVKNLDERLNDVDDLIADKTAIVKAADPDPDAWVKYYCTESPEVRFDDVLTIDVAAADPETDEDDQFTKRITAPLCPEYVFNCEPGSIQAIGHTTSKPALVGLKIEGDQLAATFNLQVLRDLPETLVVHLSGIRKGRGGVRHEKATRAQALRNAAFWSTPHTEKKGRGTPAQK